jgi:chromosomal replication initiation ATPase DnaA
MDMKKEDIELWCRGNDYVLIDMNIRGSESIDIKEVINISEQSCRIPPGSVHEKTSKWKVVFSRWLIWDYLRKRTSMSLASVGWEIGKKDHATVKHGIKCLENEVFAGDRKEFKRKFEKTIDTAHVRLGLEPVYYKYNEKTTYL